MHIYIHVLHILGLRACDDLLVYVSFRSILILRFADNQIATSFPPSKRSKSPADAHKLG